MSTPTPTNRPQRGASPAQDADQARRFADEAAEALLLLPPAERATAAGTVAQAYAALAQASLLSAILRELRFQNEEEVR